MNDSFEDIRPYYDGEIPDAMRRIARSEFFSLLAEYVFPGEEIESVRRRILGFRTIEEFQLQVMKRVNEQVIARSIASFTYDGMERLDPAKRYLFVSNHRDIMLDASLLQYVLVTNGHPTSEITFGANLMSSQLVIDIGRSNKMFRVERGGNMKDFYKSSLQCSQYIRHAITEKRQSVWIAQHNGRTKDGNDTTDQGIIKMFCMSGPQDKIASLAELCIVPVAVSYEWEPCDLLKARELCEARFSAYVKKPGEDLNSILTGILQPKGAVHFSFGRPLGEADLRPYENLAPGECHKQIAALIDKTIRSHYRLSPNNFIAHDLLHKEHRFADRYNPQQMQAFLRHIERLDCLDVSDRGLLRNIFLRIYSTPADHAHNN